MEADIGGEQPINLVTREEAVAPSTAAALPLVLTPPQPSSLPGYDPSHPLCDEFMRLQTFPLNWNAHSMFHKVQLAKAGIYYDVTSRVCICFFCGIKVNVLSPKHVNLLVCLALLNPNCSVVTLEPNLNRPMENINDYRFERHRRASYLLTDWTAPIHPFDLACWGFYWTGTGDVSRCHFCQLEIRDWRPGHEPEAVHRRFKPACRLLTGHAEDNRPMGQEGKKFLLKMHLHWIERGGMQTQQQLMESIPLTRSVCYPQFTSRVSRILTYTRWPLGVNRNPHKFVDAGFFYFGVGDRVVCFSCGGGIEGWEHGAKPFVEHALLPRDCEFLILVKGYDFIQDIRLQRAEWLKKNEAAGSSADNVAINFAVPKMLSPIADNPSTSSLDARPTAYGRRVCKVCFAKELTIVFLPCSHMSTCIDCTPQLGECPICRVKPTAYVRAALP